MPSLKFDDQHQTQSLFGEEPIRQQTKKKPKLSLVIDNDDLGPLVDAEVNRLAINLSEAVISAMKFTFLNFINTKNLPWVPLREDLPQPTLLGEENQPLNMRKEVFENLMWVMNLYDQSPILSFEAACHELEYDSVVMRSIISHQLKHELKNIYQFVKGFDDEYALRIKGKLLNYICLD